MDEKREKGKRKMKQSVGGVEDEFDLRGMWL
jgi:hypothetical protein